MGKVNVMAPNHVLDVSNTRLAICIWFRENGVVEIFRAGRCRLNDENMVELPSIHDDKTQIQKRDGGRMKAIGESSW